MYRDNPLGTLQPEALPHLRHFDGRSLDCITICDGKRPLEELTLLLLLPKFDLTIEYDKDINGKKQSVRQDRSTETLGCHAYPQMAVS